MFHLDKVKSINSLLYIIAHLGNGNADPHKVFKILYFADKKHLARYGRPITGDRYIKMTYGPVPSFVRDVTEGQQLPGIIEKHNKYTLFALTDYDLDEFSESEIECLGEALSENKNLTFKELTAKSHDSAWESATREIDYIAIAHAATDDADMLAYIQSNAINAGFRLPS